MTGQLFLHYSIVLDTKETKKSQSSVCSSAQTGLSAFTSIDESERTPEAICKEFVGESLCTEEEDTWSCQWIPSAESSIVNHCYYKDDPDKPEAAPGGQDPNLNFDDMDEAGSGASAEANVEMSHGIDLSMLDDIVLFSGRLPVEFAYYHTS